MTNIIPINPPKLKEPICSFCKSKEPPIIKSSINEHHICGRCIKLAKQRLDETTTEKA